MLFEIQRVKLSDEKHLKSALLYSVKIEAAHLASWKDCHPVHTVAVQKNTEVLEKKIRELERHLRSQYPDGQKYATFKITN